MVRTRTHRSHVSYRPYDPAPVHDREAERALLGGVIQDPHVLPAVRQMVDPDSFFFDAHQKVFRAVCELISDGQPEGQPVDLALLQGKLRKSGHLDDVGGYEYLVKLWETVPTGASATRHAQLVRDTFVRRSAAHLLAESQGDLAHPTGPTDELLARLESRVQDLRRTGGTSSLPARPLLPLVYFDDIAPALDAADFVEGVLTEGAMSVIYGESGCGKTFFTLDLALHVAAGLPWRDRAVDPKGVLYLALEGGAGIRNRVFAFKQDRQATAADLPFAVVPVALNLLDPAADPERVVEASRAAAARFRVPVGMIVVDTLSRAIAGGNENASEDMGALVQNIDRIRQSLCAHVAVIHHSGKDGAKGARGHSLLRAATYTEIEVGRDRTSGNSVARVTKQRDLDDGAEFAFRLAPVALGFDRRDKEVRSCVVRPVEPLGCSSHAHANSDDPPLQDRRNERLRADEETVLLAIDAEVAGGQEGATLRRIRTRTAFSSDRAAAVVDRLLVAQTIVAVTWMKEFGRGAAQGVSGWRRTSG